MERISSILSATTRANIACEIRDAKSARQLGQPSYLDAGIEGQVEDEEQGHTLVLDAQLRGCTPVKNFDPPYHREQTRSNSRPHMLLLLRRGVTRIRRAVSPRCISVLKSRRLCLIRRNAISSPRVIYTIFVVLLSAALFFAVLILLYGGKPPCYENVRILERKLPQHRFKSLFPVERIAKLGIVEEDPNEREDDDGDRYLRFPEDLWGHGLNNVLQEALLYALISDHANRSFVFEDFTWSHLPLPYTIYDFKLRPTRIPMSAFVGGWLVGAPNFGQINHSFFGSEGGADEGAEDGREGGPGYVTGFPTPESNYIQLNVDDDLQPTPIPWPKSLISAETEAILPAAGLTGLPERTVSQSGSQESSRRTPNPVNISTDLAKKGAKYSGRKGFNRPPVSAEHFEHVCPPSRRVEIVYTWPTSPVPPPTSAATPVPIESFIEDPVDGTALFPRFKLGFSSTLAPTSRVDARHSLLPVPPLPPVPGPSRLLKPPALPVPQSTADGVEILQWWIDRLQRDDVKNEKCLVVREQQRRVWDFEFFGSQRPLALFPLLLDSLVLREFEWSSLVMRAVERNVAHFFGASTRSQLGPTYPAIMPESLNNPAPIKDSLSGTFSAVTPIEPAIHNTAMLPLEVDDMIPGVLAVHLRRGDYKRHCSRLARWGAGYMGWNRLVGGTDFEDGLESILRNQNSSSDARVDEQRGLNEAGQQDQEARREAYYLAHCLPTIPQIVHRLREVRVTYEAHTVVAQARSLPPLHATAKLSQVYILTNAWPNFVSALGLALQADGWERVVGSTDLHERAYFDVSGGLAAEEEGVSAAIDMGLAGRAEVFVGNGFSSLSANIVMLRLARGFSLTSNQLL